MKPKEIIEIVGELPKDLKGKIVLWGFEPSGGLHEGHLNPIKALNWLESKGAIIIVWVADVNLSLNDKEEKLYEKLLPYLPKHKLLIQSYEMKKKSWEWMLCLFNLSKKITYNRCKRAIDCAGREMDKSVKMNSLIYTLLQATDAYMMNVDILVGGIDQRKVHMLIRDTFSKLKMKVPTMIHTEILLGNDGTKMSKSNPKYCKFIE